MKQRKRLKHFFVFLLSFFFRGWGLFLKKKARIISIKISVQHKREWSRVICLIDLFKYSLLHLRWGFSSEDIWNMEYLFIAITPGSTLTRVCTFRLIPLGKNEPSYLPSYSTRMTLPLNNHECWNSFKQRNHISHSFFCWTEIVTHRNLFEVHLWTIYICL